MQQVPASINPVGRKRRNPVQLACDPSTEVLGEQIEAVAEALDADIHIPHEVLVSDLLEESPAECIMAIMHRAWGNDEELQQCLPLDRHTIFTGLIEEALALPMPLPGLPLKSCDGCATPAVMLDHWAAVTELAHPMPILQRALENGIGSLAMRQHCRPCQQDQSLPTTRKEMVALKLIIDK